MIWEELILGVRNEVSSAVAVCLRQYQSTMFFLLNSILPTNSTLSQFICRVISQLIQTRKPFIREKAAYLQKLLGSRKLSNTTVFIEN